MNVVQSYLTTIMRGDFSLYEVRIFTKIVELANTILNGHKASQLIGKAVCVDGINCNLTLPVRSVMTEGSQAYDRVRKALTNLMRKEVELYNPETKEWKKATLLNNIRFAEGDGLIKFVVPKWLLEYILNFVYGNFSEYDLRNALTLPSAYAVRMYWLTCSMTGPVNYSIPMLRQMLGVGDKYGSTKDFIRRCIEPPQKILAERNLNGYNFTRGKKGIKIQYLHFEPVKREKKEVSQLTAQAGLSAWCDPLLRQYLTTQCGFRLQELNANKDTLFNFCKLPDWQDKIIKIVERQRKKRASKGYIINSMRSAASEGLPKLQKAPGKISFK